MKDADFADGIYWILSAVDWRLGGGHDTSTGIDYRNSVFETFSFWAHAECNCTYETRERDWEEGHPHSTECYQSLIRDLGSGYSWETGEEHGYQEKKNEEAISQARSLLGIDPHTPGSYVHCTCGRQERYLEWVGEATHDANCAIEDVHFRHFESGLEVKWYKRVGRSTESNKDMKILDWHKIIVECLESVRDEEPT